MESDLLIVVGDTMTDVVAHLPGDPATGTDTPADIDFRGGGSAANVASWLAHVGTPVALISRVGVDPLGEAAEADLTADGVACWFSRDPSAKTGTCIVLVGPDGERTMMPDPGANDRLSPQDLRLDAFTEGRHLHLPGYGLLRPGPRDAARAALDAALDRGLTVSVDASSAAPLALAGAHEFLEWISGADILLANAEEARVLTKETDPASAAAHLAARFPLVIVKCGAAGAYAHEADGASWHVPARPVGTLVDSTGAGDAFAAAFLNHWRLGTPLESALAFAAEISARAVSRVGGRP